jgi:transposase
MSYTREWEQQRRENRNELIRAAFAEGWPVKKIAKEYGVSETTVYAVVYEMEWPSPERRHQAMRRFGGPEKKTPIQKRLSEQQLARIVNHSDTWSRDPTERYRIYFIQEDEDGGYVKIGETWNPAQERAGQLQTGNPRRLVVRRVVTGVSEGELHEHFGHLRIRGEWFRVDDELEAFMSSDDDSTLDGDADLGDPQ